MIITQEKITRLKSLRKTFNEEDTIKIEKIAGLFPRGYLSIVASTAGTGKTWLTQYLACQLSKGGNILNGLVLDSKPMKSVIMSGETGVEILNNRLVKTDWKYNEDNISIYSAFQMALNNVEYMLNTEEGRNNIVAIMQYEKPDIVFFDTLISFHGLDESKQGEMTKIFIFLCKLANCFNCAVVCNHHTRKRPSDNPNRNQNQDDVIGTSAGVRLANAVYIASSEEEDGISKVTVKNVKNWDSKVPPFSYKFVTHQGKIDFEVNTKENSEWSLRYQIQELINNISFEAYINPSDLAKVWGYAANYIREKLNEHIGKYGELSKIQVGNKIYYRLKCWKDDYTNEIEYDTYIKSKEDNPNDDNHKKG